MPLHIKAADIPVRKRVQTGSHGTGEMAVRKAYGKEASLMWAVRQPGYHTRPHAHPCEQINYIVEGEIWFFVEDQAFECKQGDYQRIPANKVHWAWNKSDKPAVVAEVHSPPLIGGRTGEGAVGLFADDETPEPNALADNEFVEYDFAKAEEATAAASR